MGLPFIVAGDFNEPLTKSPAYHFFMDLGAVKAFIGINNKFHEDLPSTCSVQQGMIRFLCIPELPASLRQWVFLRSISSMSTLRCLLISSYLGFPGKTTNRLWSSEAIEAVYQPVQFDEIFPPLCSVDEGQIENALFVWPRHVENAVDHAVQACHRFDALNFPHTCLYEGRCGPQKFRRTQPRVSVESDRHGGIIPPCEGFHLITHKTEGATGSRNQVTCASFEKFATTWSSKPVCRAQPWICERRVGKNLNAKGYGSSWRNGFRPSKQCQ